MHYKIITRIAPTPSGDPHWGNLMNFALVWRMARERGGKLWLRFDDVDLKRCRPQFADNIKRVLEFLELYWDEEYSNQLLYLDEYKDYLKGIPHYACDCSRQDIQLRTQSSRYDGHCRDRAMKYTPFKSCIRFLSPLGAAHDFVLWRRENIPSYHLTSIADEERLGVNLILRGEDLMESTFVQKEISKQIKNDPMAKIEIIHHSLLLSQNGEKLSKSKNDGDIFRQIEAGVTKEGIWGNLGIMLGLHLANAKDLLNAEVSHLLR
jgi:glutamyl-Q tRNA(Asp) synthetase